MIVVVARCRDVAAGERMTRWLFVTRWGSWHFPPRFARRRRGRGSTVVLDALDDVMAGRSEEWRAAYFRRLRWYLDHDADMTAAPPLPDEEDR